MLVKIFETIRYIKATNKYGWILDFKLSPCTEYSKFPLG